MEEHGILVVNVQLGRVVKAGRLAVGGLAGAADRVDGQFVRQVIISDGVRFCVRRPRLGVVGAVEAVCRQHGVGRGIKGRKAQGVAEQLVGVVSAGARPVMVGAVVDIFVLVRGEGLPHVHKASSGGLYGIGKRVEITVLVQQRSARRDVFRVDGRRRRHQHYVDLARVPLTERFQRGSVLGQGARLAGNEAVGAGEHHVLFAQQDAAALLLLHHLRFHGALQGDPVVTAHHLVFDVFRVGREELVQPISRDAGQAGPLGEGGVFQFTVGPVRRDKVQQEQPGKKQGECDKDRIAENRSGAL